MGSDVDRVRGMWEKVLRKFCAPSVQAEFDGLDSVSQHRMLDALRAMAEHNHQNASEGAMWQAAEAVADQHTNQANMQKWMNGYIKRTEMSDRKCPLAAALSNNLPRVSTEGHKAVLMILQRWGVKQSPFEQLQQFKMQVEHAASRPDPQTNWTTDSTLQKREFKTVDWSALEPIKASELQMFKTHKGRVLEGVVCTDVLNQVGCSLFIRDPTGNVVLVTMYNVIPGGAPGKKGLPMARAKFPEGARVRIAEPFYKIANSGVTAVRIDSPNELQVTVPEHVQTMTVTMAREQCKAIVQKQEHLAANELYLQALRRDPCVDLVVNLLRNRAQAALQMCESVSALGDAAAAVFLRPKDIKSWSKYYAAIRMYNEHEEEPSGHVYRALEVAESQLGKPLPRDEDDEVTSETGGKLNALSVVESVFLGHIQNLGETNNVDGLETEGLSAKALKDLGNRYYTEGVYENAISVYTKAIALCPCVQDIAACLSNVALCTWKTNCHQTTIAAASAALVVGGHETWFMAHKPVVRALDVIGAMNGKSVADHLLHNMPRKLPKNFSIPSKFRDELEKRPASYVSPKVEIVEIEGKGRGLRATSVIEPGEDIMIQYPLIYAVFAEDDTNRPVADGTSGHKGHMRETGVHRLCNNMAVSLASTDAFIAKTMSYLYDGTDLKLEMPNVHKLHPDLTDTAALPLLGSEWIFYPKSEKFELPTPRVRGITDKNNFGCEKESLLYAATSLLNHAHRPNTSRDVVENSCPKASVKYHGMRTFAVKPIPPGEEITCSYTNKATDESVKNWLGDSYGHDSLK
jgi:tetratricopeptide (TPR) repeat protein